MKNLKYALIVIMMLVLAATCVKATMSADNIDTNIKEENNAINVASPINVIHYKDTTINTLASVNQDKTSIKPVEVSKNNVYSNKDIYLLAKIAMAEAEGESELCKEYVIQTILNRVESDDFPDSIYDVIFDGHQFSPTFDGRWEKVEPNNECYTATYNVINSDHPIIDSLYFECCDGDSWHSRNLEKILEECNTRFYK